MSFEKKIINAFKLSYNNVKWRKRNSFNNTDLGTFFPIDMVSVGRHSYGTINYLYPVGRLIIGNYVSIAPEVKFLGGGHDYERISTFPFQTVIYQQPSLKTIHKDIIIGDDVWIGYDSIIMGGVNIGQGSVIGARSMVTRDIEPYSVYVGNRVIKKRFSDDIISKLIEIDYSKIEHAIDDNYNKFCQYKVETDNVEIILRAFCSNGN